MKIATFAGLVPHSRLRLWLAPGTLALMLAAPGAIGATGGREPALLRASPGPSFLQVAALTPAEPVLRAEPDTAAGWRVAMPAEIVGIAARNEAPLRQAADHGYLFVDPQEGRKLLLQGGARADGIGRVQFVRLLAAWSGAGADAPRVRVTTSVDGLVSLSVRADAMQAALVRHGAAPAGHGGWALAARSMDEAMSSVIDSDALARANRVTERNGQVVLSHEAGPPVEAP